MSLFKQKCQYCNITLHNSTKITEYITKIDRNKEKSLNLKITSTKSLLILSLYEQIDFIIGFAGEIFLII